MAADGDQFQRRIMWGWGKPYRMACRGSSPSEVAPHVITCLRNMLRRDFRSPALGLMIGVVEEFLEERQSGLFRADEDRLIESLQRRLEGLQRQYPEFESSALIRQACNDVALACSAHPGAMPPKQIREMCCEGFIDLLFRRYGSDPMQCDIMKSRGFDRLRMDRYRDEVFEAVKPEIVGMVMAMANSPSGALPRRRCAGQPAIAHTATGLAEPLPGVSP